MKWQLGDTHTQNNLEQLLSVSIIHAHVIAVGYMNNNTVSYIHVHVPSVPLTPCYKFYILF